MKDVSLEKVGLLLVDIQEKLFAKIVNHTTILPRVQRVIQACELLGMPIVVSEQYPEGLGPTISSINTSFQAKKLPCVSEKTHFSCWKNKPLQKALKEKCYWILVGIETHICVQQTALDMQKSGLLPLVAVDATGSRNTLDHTEAIITMRQQGIVCSTTEALIFMLLQDAKHPKFKSVAPLFR